MDRPPHSPPSPTPRLPHNPQNVPNTPSNMPQSPQNGPNSPENVPNRTHVPNGYGGERKWDTDATRNVIKSVTNGPQEGQMGDLRVKSNPNTPHTPLKTPLRSPSEPSSSPNDPNPPPVAATSNTSNSNSITVCPNPFDNCGWALKLGADGRRELRSELRKVLSVNKWLRAESLKIANTKTANVSQLCHLAVLCDLTELMVAINLHRDRLYLRRGGVSKRRGGTERRGGLSGANFGGFDGGWGFYEDPNPPVNSHYYPQNGPKNVPILRNVPNDPRNVPNDPRNVPNDPRYASYLPQNGSNGPVRAHLAPPYPIYRPPQMSQMSQNDPNGYHYLDRRPNRMEPGCESWRPEMGYLEDYGNYPPPKSGSRGGRNVGYDRGVGVGPHERDVPPPGYGYPNHQNMNNNNVYNPYEEENRRLAMNASPNWNRTAVHGRPGKGYGTDPHPAHPHIYPYESENIPPSNVCRSVNAKGTCSPHYSNSSYVDYPPPQERQSNCQSNNIRPPLPIPTHPLSHPSPHSHQSPHHMGNANQRHIPQRVGGYDVIGPYSPGPPGVTGGGPIGSHIGANYGEYGHPSSVSESQYGTVNIPEYLNRPDIAMLGNTVNLNNHHNAITNMPPPGHQRPMHMPPHLKNTPITEELRAQIYEGHGAGGRFESEGSRGTSMSLSTVGHSTYPYHPSGLVGQQAMGTMRGQPNDSYNHYIIGQGRDYRTDNDRHNEFINPSGHTHISSPAQSIHVQHVERLPVAHSPPALRRLESHDAFQ